MTWPVTDLRILVGFGSAVMLLTGLLFGLGVMWLESWLIDLQARGVDAEQTRREIEAENLARIHASWYRRVK